MDKEFIVVFGGTFDPVHNGHLHAARSVADYLSAPRVLLMPTAQPPHKSTHVTEARHRLAMLELAAAEDSRLQVSRMELERGGASYTYKSVQQLRELYGSDVEIAWVVGLDMLTDLPHWYRAAELVEQIRVITVVRPPVPEDFSQLARSLAVEFGDATAKALVSDILEVEALDISSTDIRQLCRSGRVIDSLVCPAVAKYIAENGLYRG